jgi:multidrug efflux pump subunit AcrA (membrane-fusion protein)
MAHLQADNFQLQEQLCSARAEARLHAQADAAAEVASVQAQADAAIFQTKAASAAELAELNRLRTDEVFVAQVLASSKLEEADAAIAQARAASSAAIAATLNMSRSERKMLKRRAEAPIPTESPRTVGIQPPSTASSSTCLPPAVAPVPVATPMPMSVITPASPATPSP